VIPKERLVHITGLETGMLVHEPVRDKILSGRLPHDVVVTVKRLTKGWTPFPDGRQGGSYEYEVVSGEAGGGGVVAVESLGRGYKALRSQLD
jgi:hypothetical protein